MATLEESRIQQSAVVLANAAELAAHVIQEVAGNDVSDTLNGSRITMTTLRALAQSRIKRNLDATR